MMRPAHEIRSPNDLDVPKTGEGWTKKEMDLAHRLIDTLADKWKPEEFRNTYTEVLRKAIEAKVGGKELELPREAVNESRWGAEPVLLRLALNVRRQRSAHYSCQEREHVWRPDVNPLPNSAKAVPLLILRHFRRVARKTSTSWQYGGKTVVSWR